MARGSVQKARAVPDRNSDGPWFGTKKARPGPDLGSGRAHFWASTRAELAYDEPHNHGPFGPSMARVTACINAGSQTSCL